MTFKKGQSGNPKGRPRKAEKFAGEVSRAERQIADRLPELIDLQMELARGVWVEETSPDGPRRVYQRPPDRQAGQYLIDRIMGKPTERREEDHRGGITIKVVYDDIDPGAPEAA